MRVGETLSFDEYWDDPRFQNKRPNLRGSKKQAFGDNIYHRPSSSHDWIQEDSHHSHADGTQNPRTTADDMKTNRILVSDDYIYFGGEGPELPLKFRSAACDLRKAGRGHRSQFPHGIVDEFITWVKSLGVTGYVGEPLDWVRTP